MAQKQTKHIFTGLNRDMSPDKVDNKYYFDALNIRVNVKDEETLLSVTNEVGTEQVVNNIAGKCLGKAVIGKYIVLFTHEANNDHIWRIDTENFQDSIDLYGKGSLGFDNDHYIDTVISYENDKIQKVYWCDGLNQNRVINIVAPHLNYKETSFDFIQVVNNSLILSSVKDYGSGSFTAGTVQYFATYFNKNGQESNIVARTPIMYISEKGKGSEPNTSVANIITLSLQDIDLSWDYVRIYALDRTSKDTEASARIVSDIPTKTVYNEVYNGSSINDIVNINIDDGHWFIPVGKPNSIRQYYGSVGDEIEIHSASHRGIVLYDGTPLYIKPSFQINQYDMYHEDSNISLYNKDNHVQLVDTGIGESISPAELFMIGGIPFSSDTMDAKDNVLFLGNINLCTSSISNDIKKAIHEAETQWNYISTYIKVDENFYDRTNQLDLSSISTFKAGETYRFGLQFQDKFGVWSEPIWVKDSAHNKYPDDKGFNVKVMEFYLDMNQPKLLPALQKIKDQGYINVRPVAVMPKPYEREVVCQGVLNPTVYNVKDRFENGPYTQSSWFYRPIPPTDKVDDPNIPSDLKKGSWLAYRHGEGIYGGQSRSAEIAYGVQGPCGTSKSHPSIYVNYNKESQFVADNSELYYVDSNLVTLDSPDITFDDNINIDNTFLRIVGVINMAAFMSDINMDVAKINDPYGFFSYKVQVHDKSDENGYKATTTGAYYSDILLTKESPDPEFTSIAGFSVDNLNKTGAVAYAVYAWNRSGNLNVFFNSQDAKLLSKTISNIRYSDTTTYIDNPVNFDSIVSKIHSGATQSKGLLMGEKFYYTPDKLLAHDCDFIVSNSVDIIMDPNSNTHIHMPCPTPNPSEGNTWFPIKQAGDVAWFRADVPVGTIAGDVNKLALMNGETVQDYNLGLYAHTGVTPNDKRNALIPINYSMSRHAVIDLNNAVLPSVNGKGKAYLNTSDNKYPFYDKNNKVLSQQNIVIDGLNNGVLLIGELYRNVVNKFGGTSDFALQHNDWVIAGKTKPINSNSSPIIEWTIGDTYFQRYDHLKTYPYNTDSVNNLVEILSFMVETRVNIDGRYDNNRGLESNLYINNTNFNLLNNAYSQLDSFVKAKILDDRFTENKFSSTVTYTKSKAPNALTDAWTNTTLTNTVDLDGSKGDIIKIINYNDSILAFQQSGIAEIIFNPNVQISSANGLPIEIANSGKVQGKRYIFDNIGLQSKRAISNTRSGLWWIDIYNNALFKFNKDLNDVTYTHGMKSWLDKNKDLRVDYDTKNGSIYLTNDNSCLGFAETLDCFESFYSYAGSEVMMSVKDEFFSLYHGSLWKHHAGTYNTFYGNVKPSMIEFIHNENPDFNKTYNTLDYRAQFTDDKTFNYFKVSNEYQSTDDTIDPNVVRKFRNWRYQIPRDRNHRFDRIQNTWSKIKIGYKPTDSNIAGFRLYDVIVGYDV